MLRLKKSLKDDIPVSAMKDGDIAVIIKWGHTSGMEHIGEVVQRYGNSLISLGQGSSHCWPDSVHRWADSDNLRVRILPPGTELVIE